MILIGEKINSSIPSAGEMMKNGDTEGLKNLVISQAGNGADYIDINTALSGNEEKMMLMLAEVVSKETDCGVMLDSPDSELLCRVLPSIKNSRIILNSVREDGQFEKMCNAAREYDTFVVGMPAMGAGSEKTENALRLAEKILKAGIASEKILMDICVESVAVNPESAIEAFDILKKIKSAFPGVLTTCGLSNISFGLPKRVEINASFLSAAVTMGLDSAILDVNSQKTMFSYYAAEALCGRDEYCMNYMEFYRKTSEK